MYDCIIVGGGIAGLQAAIQLGRYGRRILVVDRGDGRSTLCRSYHNVLGYPDGVSGETLRRIGREQAAKYGAEFAEADATGAAKSEDGAFRLQCRPDSVYLGKTLLLATGVMDRIPDMPGLRSCLGLTAYICPDCDGYEIKDKHTLVLGSGNTGARMALALKYYTPHLIYVNHEQKPVDAAIAERLRNAGITITVEPVREVFHEGAAEEGSFAGVILANGKKLEADRAFIAFGGNEVRSDLASQLGAERMENLHIITDPRSKMTSVPGVWAAGDVAVHSEQLTIAMGEGQQAAIWIHKWLLRQRKREE
ncbi:NAD(P)/FAD-dependent oxidoreductase [Paenibacillus alkalitolerans]|uniref:NAD(P)/FAD-dependent oxidoreductase n=1 Tax=Paenibacillus alkalitolerans TaxID=2799335 RepID=UPI0018F4E192|nr:NAD(P)/FAD-dependent oxidoreductase [Paenibacillus alkalitolerans]